MMTRTPETTTSGLSMADNSPSQEPPPDPSQPTPKRIRLSLACTACRKRKVRCDAETPKCRNCRLRGDVCQTTDPRKPEAVVSRKWPAKTSRLLAEQGLSIDATGGDGQQRPLGAAGTSPRGETESVPDAVETEAPQTLSRIPISFLTRAYHASTRERGGERCLDDAESPDIVVNTDESSHRVKYLGGSSLQCLCIFVDLFLKQKGLGPVSQQFRFGMRHVEEFALPITVYRPNLPPIDVIEEHVRVFFRRIWPVFPVVDHEALMTDIRRLLALQNSSLSGEESHYSLQTVIQPSDVPALVSIYLIISIAADEAAGNITETGTKFLDAAYSFYGHVVALPYLGSVQALLLLVIALRGKGKEGQGWHVLGQAIRTAHSIGLHRHISTHDTRPRRGTEPGYKADLQLHGRLWWTCYSLEKLMEMETGRPSAITDYDCDQVLPRSSYAAHETPDYFGIWVSLSHILGRISEHIYRKRQTSSYVLFNETGKLDKALTDWAGSLPESLRPGQETPILSEHGRNDNDQTQQQQHIAAFLSIHYHQAQITLFRASLIFSSRSYAAEVRLYPTSLSAATQARLLQSQHLAIAAARSVAKLVLDLADNGVESQLFTPTQAFLAAAVLALHILRNPRKRMARADLELLSEATGYCEEQWRRLRQDPDFIRGCTLLRERVQAVCRGGGREQRPHDSDATTVSEPVPSGSSAARSGSGFGSPSAALPSELSLQTASDSTAMAAGPQLDQSALFDPFAGLPLDELWPMLGTEFLIDDNDSFIQME
ncbi:fungal-specific transcription factor domain-containing protein [Apiospora sp. TS-2023a]